MYLPGKRCLYLSQTLAFKQPVYLGDMVTVTGVVTAKSEVTKIITIQTTTKKGDVIVVEGEARVQMI
jgi:3-hydroxybutyryl-CoA dehydratase